MKKILCLILGVLLIIPTLAFADVSGEVSYSQNGQSIYIAGDLSKTESADGNYVTLLITDKTSGAIKYISQLSVDSQKRYETKFIFKDNLEDCNISIKEGNNIVNSSVTASYAEGSTFYSLTLRDENGSHYIEPEELIKATAYITNKHKSGGKYKIIGAFYDES